VRRKAPERRLRRLGPDRVHLHQPVQRAVKEILGTGTVALRQPSQNTTAIIRAADQVLKAIYKVGYEYKKAGVIVGGITSATASANPLSLFTDEEDELTNDRQHKLMQVMDKINRKYGS
jgi:DNA polymerase V